jgi:hypothetical protein
MNTTKKHTEQVFKSHLQEEPTVFRLKGEKLVELYTPPHIEKIILDNEISLALESTPPEGPDETLLAPGYFKNNPFKDNHWSV